jgi:hypothetical protein
LGTKARLSELLGPRAAALVRRFNRADAGTLVAPSEYLEVVITKQ